MLTRGEVMTDSSILLRKIQRENKCHAFEIQEVLTLFLLEVRDKFKRVVVGR